MITHKANENGQPINELGEVMQIKAPTLFNGVEVLEFETFEEYQNYITDNYGKNTEN